MEKKYDLEQRTLEFAKKCIDISKALERNQINFNLVDQLLRASTSVGANYREANQTITKKEFFYRINLCRKESKESKYWLELLHHANTKLADELDSLIDEALQLLKIFSAIALGK